MFDHRLNSQRTFLVLYIYTVKDILSILNTTHEVSTHYFVNSYNLEILRISLYNKAYLFYYE